MFLIKERIKTRRITKCIDKKTNKTLLNKQWQEDVTIYVLTITIKYHGMRRLVIYNLLFSSTIHREYLTAKKWVKGRNE